MATLTTYSVVSKRLAQWSTESPPFRESAVEAVLLFDLFRGVLDFDANSAKRQVRVPKTGRTDIILRLNDKVKVVVEVKRFDTFASKAKTEQAIRQAAKYVRELKSEYGIITDGINWVYFTVRPHGNYHQIRRLIRFNIKEQPELALAMLKRSRKGTLNHFFKLLASIHGEMTEKEFARLMNLSLQERVEQLAQKAKQNDPKLEVTSGDKSLLKVLYGNANANQSVKLGLKPMNLTGVNTKKKSSKS